MEKIERTNKDCPLIDSSICLYAGCEGCDSCYIAGQPLSKSELENSLENWKVTQSFMPDNVDDLHTTDICMFCRSENPNKADCYAVIDLAHPEPEHKRGAFFGMGKKVRSEYGSLIQLPITVCRECTKLHRRGDIFRIGMGFLGIALGVILLVIPSTYEFFYSTFALMPMIVLGACTALGFIVGNIMASINAKKSNQKTHLNVLEVPIIREMVQKGWFPLQGKSATVHVAFVKRKPRPNVRFK